MDGGREEEVRGSEGKWKCQSKQKGIRKGKGRKGNRRGEKEKKRTSKMDEGRKEEVEGSERKWKCQSKQE